jgi:hypothetical protein
MVDDFDSDQGGGGEDQNDSFIDIDDVIPNSSSTIAITCRISSQTWLKTQDMFPNDLNIKALIIAINS